MERNSIEGKLPTAHGVFLVWCQAIYQDTAIWQADIQRQGGGSAAAFTTTTTYSSSHQRAQAICLWATKIC